MMIVLFYSFLLFLLLSRSVQCATVYNVTVSEPLFPNQTLVSSDEFFELGFFTPNGSSSQYLGIWFKNLTPTKVVWVANRDKPLARADQLASLAIGSDGNLQLGDGSRNVVWSSNISKTSNRSSAFLLNSGNFVLADLDSEKYLWESYTQLSDTLLPDMKLGINLRTGERRFLTCWKSDTDPSPGDFVVGITSRVPPQPFIWYQSTPYWRGGVWDKSKFIGIPNMTDSYVNGFSVQQDIPQGTTYFSFTEYGSYGGYMFISPNGSLELIYWDDQARSWSLNWIAPENICSRYGVCGPFGVCNETLSPICRCLDGFVPVSIDEWSKGNWTRGCVRVMELRCSSDSSTSESGTPSSLPADVFLKRSQMKLPDRSGYLAEIEDPSACQNWCLGNCSCVAYSYVDNIGCLLWFDDLIDLQQFNSSGKDLFIRVAQTEAGVAYRKPGNGKTKLIIGVITICGFIILGVAAYRLYKRKANKNGGPVRLIKTLRFSANTHDNERAELHGKISQEQSQANDAYDLPVFDFNSILIATANFSITNKLGQGGFGPVYKGKLQDGQEIAVKRLSSNSGQGMEEFKNELILISKLQHRNLVKLKGCCIEREERILVYEYLLNKSLDTFIFDSRRKAQLDWKKRFIIIQGIARGLLYLHRDSCLRVIHRDLKASNILLDEKMNPKISDFGLARMFQGTQDLVNTRRVVGTLGYMSPEYAMGGIFSEKSDVYSFGVLLLEIISSRRNTTLYYHGETTLNLLSYAWQMWSNGRGLELLDEELIDPTSSSEVKKCIQIGLLCVQDHAIDRPNMASVVLMLSGESELPEPKPPTLTSFQNRSDHEVHSQHDSTLSANTITNTMTEGR